MRLYIKRLFLTGVIAAIFVTVVGFLNRIHPLFDTVAHFRLHVSVGLILASLILLPKRFFLLSAISIFTGLIGLWQAASGTPFTREERATIPDNPVYQMFHLNLFWINPKKQLVINRIMEIDPQLISISEASTTWEPYLKSLESRWPHTAHCPEWHVRGGVKILSKWKIDPTDEYCGSYGSFQKSDIILDDGGKVTIGSVHPRWPWPASGPRQMEEFVPILQEMGPDALIAGDFNATTWSWSTQKFAEAGGLAMFNGVGGTWMFGALPAPIVRTIGFPIDNVMSKGRVRVLSVETLESLGSDHLPLLINFQIE
ncbi:MAG: endonuclease/exonuclease/phosphatase family protein [Rhizobiaceae bacterium]